MSSANSYKTILKSSSLIGGSEVIKLIIGMVQVKFVAVLLGPFGVGLVGTYSSLIGLILRISGLGIAGSGVREIAEAVGSEDNEKIGRKVLTLRRICWLTGTTGAISTVILAKPLSLMTFGTIDHAWSLILLGWIILIRSIQSAQMSYLQGLRRIGDLAKLKIIGEIGGAAIGIGFYVWLKLDGIVPALLSLAVFNLTASWWFARKVPPPPSVMTWKESLIESKQLVRLGIVLMWNGLLSTGVAYLTRVLINLSLGVAAVGIFQSAFRLSGIFVNFVLQAMGTDFYPRLTRVADDNKKVNQLVNEQTEIGLLLAVPGILAIMVLAPWVIKIFYTSEFSASAELLQWFALGCLGRVISWPMGIILLAKGNSRWLLLSETFANVIHIFLIWVGLKYFGILGVAIAFFALYVGYVVLMKFISYKISGFSWNSDVCRLLITTLISTTGLFIVIQFVQEMYATIIGVVAVFIITIYCLRELIKRVGFEHKLSIIIRRIPFSKYLIVN